MGEQMKGEQAAAWQPNIFCARFKPSKRHGLPGGRSQWQVAQCGAGTVEGIRSSQATADAGGGYQDELQEALLHSSLAPAALQSSVLGRAGVGRASMWFQCKWPALGGALHGHSPEAWACEPSAD